MDNKTVFALMERTRWGNELHLFDSKEKREAFYQVMLSEYIQDYDPAIQWCGSVEDITEGDCWVEMYELSVK